MIGLDEPAGELLRRVLSCLGRLMYKTSWGCLLVSWAIHLSSRLQYGPLLAFSTVSDRGRRIEFQWSTLDLRPSVFHAGRQSVRLRPFRTSWSVSLSLLWNEHSSIVRDCWLGVYPKAHDYSLGSGTYVFDKSLVCGSMNTIVALFCLFTI